MDKTRFNATTEQNFSRTDRCFTVPEMNSGQLGINRTPRPISRFQVSLPMLTLESEKSGMSEGTSVQSQSSSEHFAATIRNPLVQTAPQSPPTFANGYENNEKTEGSDKSRNYSFLVTQITNRLANFSREVEAVEDHLEGLKRHEHQQNDVLRRAEETAELRRQEIQECKSSLNDLHAEQANSKRKMAEILDQLTITSSENAQLSDALDNEKEDHNNTRERLNSQIKNLKSRVKDDGMNLAKRNKEYIESKKELSYLQRCIEDEIRLRKQISIDRDKICSQANALKEALESEKSKNTAKEKQHKADLVDAKKVYDEQRNRDASTIQILQEQGAKAQCEVEELTRSYDVLSETNSALQREKESAIEGMQSVFANVRNFSGVIQFCEDEQDWRFRFAADLWSKELRQTGSLKIGILAKDMTDAEAESTSLFQKICILSRMLKVLFETARNREVVFTEYSSTTKVALRDISTECVRIDNIAKEIQENFLRMKKQHQSVRLETTKLSHALREASKYWKAYQTNFLEVSQGLRLERAVRKEAAQNLNTCQSDLKATRDENTVLLEDLAGRRAMAAKLAASLSEIEEREAKGRKDLSECRKNLENHQTEREKLSKAKMCEIESLQKVLAEEKAASQQAIQKCEKWEVEFQNSVGEYEELLNSAKADKRIIQNELEAEKAKTEQFEKLKSELEKEKEIAAQDRKTYELEYARVVRMMKAEHSLKHDRPECSDEIQKEMTGIDDMQTGNQLRAKERVSLLEKRSATVKSGSEGVSNSQHLQENLKGEPVTNILQKGCPSRNVVRDKVIDPRDTARAPDVPELRPSVRKRRGSKATPIRKKSRTVVGDVASRGRKQSSRNAKKARKERCRNSDESEDNHSDDDDWFLPYE